MGILKWKLRDYKKVHVYIEPTRFTKKPHNSKGLQRNDMFRKGYKETTTIERVTKGYKETTCIEKFTKKLHVYKYSMRSFNYDRIMTELTAQFFYLLFFLLLSITHRIIWWRYWNSTLLSIFKYGNYMSFYNDASLP